MKWRCPKCLKVIIAEPWLHRLWIFSMPRCRACDDGTRMELQDG